MRRKLKGGNANLMKWVKKALGLVKKHAPRLAKKYKLGSRGLAYASKAMPKYSKFIDPVQKFAAQQGYGLKGVGGVLRGVGGGRHHGMSRRIRRK